MTPSTAVAAPSGMVDAGWLRTAIGAQCEFLDSDRRDNDVPRAAASERHGGGRTRAPP